jgi:uncharacterized protein (TIGR02646 family)
MIFVDRKNVKAPDCLTAKNSKGRKERENAIKHFSKSIMKFNFTAYKQSDVKDALIQLFNGKCAYCESKILHLYPGDVEHFRPKSLIKYPKEDKVTEIKPGYYWLASDWNNLLLACKNCNSPATHILPDGTHKVMGKWDYFPLSDSRRHIKSPSSRLANEENYRLLVNPCLDDPEKIFQFDEKFGTIKARSKDDFEILMAEKSIDIYGLDRMYLVHERKKVMLDCFIQLRRIEEALDIIDNATSQKQKAKYMTILRREINLLKSYCQPQAPYSAVAKQIFNKYFKPILGK